MLDKGRLSRDGKCAIGVRFHCFLATSLPFLVDQHVWGLCLQVCVCVCEREYILFEPLLNSLILTYERVPPWEAWVGFFFVFCSTQQRIYFIFGNKYDKNSSGLKAVYGANIKRLLLRLLDFPLLKCAIFTTPTHASIFSRALMLVNLPQSVYGITLTTSKAFGSIIFNAERVYT